MSHVVNAQKAPAEAWNLQLYGLFTLEDPLGRSIAISNRKVQALLAILAINAESGASRADLGAILWPEAPKDKRQANLRQTIARAREAIGKDLILSHRTHCQLDPIVSVQAPPSDSTRTFMMGFEGEWFKSVRERGTRDFGAVTDSFANMLFWLSEHDPARTLGMMRENLGMTLGLGVEDRRRILAKIPDDRSLPGWLSFFRSGLQNEGYVSIATQLHATVKIAESVGDHLLGVQAAVQLCICAKMQNRISEALEIADWCMRLAERSGDPSLLPTATQMKALTLLFAGNATEGFALLESSEQLYKNYLDPVIIQAVRAQHLVAFGRFREAEECLKAPKKLSRETGHGLLKVICGLVETQIQAPDLDSNSVLEHALRVVELTGVYSERRLMVLATEDLARAYIRVGDLEKAKASADHAKRIRGEMSMRVTEWDKRRIASALRP